jgi:L-aspartate oxidase
MRSDRPDITTDYAVVGSGIAGLWFAYRASRTGSVTVITKKHDTESNTNYAQGGIAAAFAEDDSPELHFRDTVAAGAGLARESVARLVTEAGPRLVRELSSVGVRFSSYEDSHGHRHFDLGQEGGHHRRRIVHARDLTGAEVERGLLAAVRARGRVTILEQHLAEDLVIDREGRCRGVGTIDQETGRRRTVGARVCLLATGGIGQVYVHTTNPPIATGDGVAMACRAGATIANMEFIQFHPTALYGSSIDGRVFLISEALRGEGAVLRTRDGCAFMERYHPDGSLAPRDVVARAIADELAARGDDCVLLDATHLPPQRLADRFPNIAETCRRFGIDVATRPIPVVPAAHYACGGVAVDEWGRTSIPGLFSAGECACTGLHGANRLASNSLLEALVFADRAAAAAADSAAPSAEPGRVPVKAVHGQTLAPAQREELRRRVQRAMWEHAGIVRSDAGLESAGRTLAEVAASLAGRCGEAAAEQVELANLATVARLIVACARLRPESRGLHFNRDHPSTDPRYAKDTLISGAALEPD